MINGSGLYGCVSHGGHFTSSREIGDICWTPYDLLAQGILLVSIRSQFLAIPDVSFLQGWVLTGGVIKTKYCTKITKESGSVQLDSKV